MTEALCNGSNVSGDKTIHRTVPPPGQFHTLLRNERGEQLIEKPHDGRIAGELVRTVALVRLDTVFLDVSRNDAGERAPQVSREIMHGLVAMQLQRAH